MIRSEPIRSPFIAGAERAMDLAYAWLCTRRKDCHSNDDVWHLRFHWKREKPRLLQALCDGTFRFDCVD